MECNSKKCVHCRKEIDRLSLVCCYCANKVISKDKINYFAYAISLPRFLWVLVIFLCLTAILLITSDYWRYSLAALAIASPFFWFAYDGHKKYIKWDHSYLYSRYLERKEKQLEFKFVFLFIVFVFNLLFITKPNTDDFKFNHGVKANSGDFIKIDFFVLSVYCSPINKEQNAYLAIFGNIYKLVYSNSHEKNLKDCKRMQKSFTSIDISSKNQ